MREGKKTFLNIFFIILLTVVSAIQVMLLNQYSTTGEKLTFITRKVEEVEKENDKLSQKIASSTSRIAISTRAQDLGLFKNTSVLSLTTPLRFAYSPQPL